MGNGTMDDRALRRLVERCDRRGYPALKELRGAYRLGDFELSVDRVQGDPFAAPSKLSAFVPHDVAGFSADLFDTPRKRTAFEDYLVRAFGRELARESFKVHGSGKSGLLATSRPGPEILERTACVCGRDGFTVRFEAGLPANGRSVAGDGLALMLLELVPACVRRALFAAARPAGEARAVADLAEDQEELRVQVAKRGLVCFVADGSVLPRESGVSSRPMRKALPFESPESLRVEVDLPHRGRVAGMGIPRGVTLVVGGGYHGKSTLLKAIEAGVYDHVAGDGRELVATDPTAVKLRAEDGRAVHGTDVSLFIGEVPSGADVHRFRTADASGSTSQAASAVEALAAGARTLLMDEDTCATNFMVRDELMAAVVDRDHEPIVPFVERVRDLYDKVGVSSVIVAGSSGAFFGVADTVLQMDGYRAYDVTARVRSVCAERGVPAPEPAPGFVLPRGDRRLSVPVTRRSASHGGGGRGGAREGRVKSRARGLDEVQAGEARADLRLVEQLVDPEQLEALSLMVRLAVQRGLLETASLDEAARAAMDAVARGGLEALQEGRPACGLAMPRAQEVFACFDRLRV